MTQSRLESLEVDAVCTILSDATRRSIVCYLREVESATARELAGQLASSDGHGADDAGHDSRRTALVELVHVHLPRLAEHDIVEYDDPAEEVTLGSNVDEVEAFVEPSEGTAAE
ncbi:DUF7344 domain-containing protein [Natrinema salaciae]|uniref:DUF7344 domain-containing protein n=1 Tax=Natrinema salaciae TaxID=1186196 RepID=A0A1H9AXC6_9EURY|nr:hypothetical protein [Natrinema salaciae]SEP81462.1 hypothetical protein SAMN04489841_0575 [Natrinema salaciae]